MAGQASLFDMLDRNHDGVISRAEFDQVARAFGGGAAVGGVVAGPPQSVACAGRAGGFVTYGAAPPQSFPGAIQGGAIVVQQPGAVVAGAPPKTMPFMGAAPVAQPQPTFAPAPPQAYLAAAQAIAAPPMSIGAAAVPGTAVPGTAQGAIYAGGVTYGAPAAQGNAVVYQGAAVPAPAPAPPLTASAAYQVTQQSYVPQTTVQQQVQVQSYVPPPSVTYAAAPAQVVSEPVQSHVPVVSYATAPSTATYTVAAPIPSSPQLQSRSVAMIPASMRAVESDIPAVAGERVVGERPISREELAESGNLVEGPATRMSDEAARQFHSIARVHAEPARYLSVDYYSQPVATTYAAAPLSPRASYTAAPAVVSAGAVRTSYAAAPVITTTHVAGEPLGTTYGAPPLSPVATVPVGAAYYETGMTYGAPVATTAGLSVTYGGAAGAAQYGANYTGNYTVAEPMSASYGAATSGARYGASYVGGGGGGASLFDMMDTDHDGVISREEFGKACAAFGGQRGGLSSQPVAVV